MIFVKTKKIMSRLRVGICSSLTASVLQKLQSVGVVNVVDFVSHDLDVLATKSGVGYRELAAIRRALISQYAAPIVSGFSLFDVVVATTSFISVGCRVLDALLEGGILSSEITEVVMDRSGALDVLVINTVAAVVAAMKKNVVFIDTSNRFNVSHIAAMLSRQPGVDLESALQQVRVVKCFDVLELLGELSMLCQAPGPFYSSLKLIVIDGIMDCILPPLSHLPNNTGCGYVAQLIHLLRQLITDSCYAVLLCTGDGCAVTSKNSATPRLTSVSRLWHSVPDTRLNVVDISVESNEHDGADNPAASRLIKVTVEKSNRLQFGQSVELAVNEHGLFV